jgi:hypothetical protein
MAACQEAPKLFDDGHKMPRVRQVWLKTAGAMKKGLQPEGHPVMHPRRSEPLLGLERHARNPVGPE